jgi:uncharacterized protein YtpQ (UPF0354 family)
MLTRTRRGGQVAGLAGLCCAVVFLMGQAAGALLTSDQFTKEFAERLRQKATVTKVEITGERQLDVTTSGGGVVSYLDHAFQEYSQKPENKLAIMDHYMTAIVEAANKADKERTLDAKRIVPVIKDRSWLESVRQALRQAGGGAKAVEPVFDEFNHELIVVYAEDQANKIRFLGAEEIAKAKVERAKLRDMAVGNLVQILPKVQQVGAGGFFVVQAGGMYESSLLLQDSLWKKGVFDVKGDVVVAIPARDILVVTGSDDANGLTKMKAAIELAKNSAYPLTSEMFVYREGKFVRFVPKG